MSAGKSAIDKVVIRRVGIALGIGRTEGNANRKQCVGVIESTGGMERSIDGSILYGGTPQGE